MLPVRGSLSLGSILLLYLMVVVVVAVVGGLVPAVGGAVVAFLLANFFFTPPYRTLAVESRDAAVALLVFVVVAVLVALTVDVSAQRRVAAARSEERAQLMAERAQRLAERTRHLAEQADRLAGVDRARAALLAAVGHDLRTPLSGIKAAASSLRQDDVTWSPADQSDLLETIETGADRLDHLIGNLLALSRLQAGVLSVAIQPVALDEVVARALLDGSDAAVVLDVDERLPAVRADPGLLERVVANLVANASRFTPPGGTVEIRADVIPRADVVPRADAVAGADAGLERTGDTVAESVRLLVVDHGPGVPESSWDAMFEPFQRLDDRSREGAGLGLAIVRGFTEAMGASVVPQQTPGGGLTMVVTLAVAEEGDAP